MTDPPINLFNALFQFQPREGHSPKENFLSEAFAYVLMTCQGARDAWLSLVMDRQVQASQYSVTTRQTQRDDQNIPLFPDMKIAGVLRGGDLLNSTASISGTRHAIRFSSPST